MMGSISENEASGGVNDFLNGGTKTPSRATRSKNTGGRSSSRRRHVDAPTQSRSTSKSAAESEERSDDKSYTQTTNENDASSSHRNFRYGSNIHSSSKTKTPKTKTSSSAKAERRIVRSPTEIVLSPAKKFFVQKMKQIDKAMKDASTQTEVKEVVFTTRLNQDVTRSVQNRAQGDLNRGIVGKGELRIMKYFQGSLPGSETHFICQLVDDGTLKFQAKIPDSSEAHKHMFLNPEVENSFKWDAYDASGRAIIRREFCFVFDDGPVMFTFLLHLFGGCDVDIVREFLKGGAGRFMPTKQTLPSHSIVKNEDDMDVNSDDEEHRPAPLNKAEEAELYGKGEVVEMSQLW